MYEIEFDPKGNFCFWTISEVVCRIICDVEDRGDRYSESSRFLYSFNGYAINKEGFQFGSAKGCIQSYILDRNKQDEKLFIYAITNNGSRLKMRPVTEQS